MDVLELIYEVIDEINLDLEPAAQIKKEEDSIIFGPESALDSMGLVNLITLIEQRIEEKTDQFIAIADERAMSMETSPFKSVKSLKEYIEVLLNE